jgi:hypothetical protein
MSLHSNTLFRFRANHSLLFLLNAACLAEKQQISNSENPEKRLSFFKNKLVIPAF